MKREKRKKKKLRLKWQFKLILIIIIFVLYAFFVGTKGITVKEYNVKTKKININMDGLKVLQFSDLHYGSSVNLKDVKQIIDKINETKPDIVIFTGDLINEKYVLSNNEKNTLIKYFSKIKVELGKYYVTGEEDDEEGISILNESNFINLDNKEQLIYKESNTPILLAGKKNIENYLKDEEIFKILAIHDPDEIIEFKDYNIDMTIAGHTHNGQINIPKIKELLIKSKYKKSVQKINNNKLFINPGIGTSKLNVRLFNRPTIYLYRITKTS